jgi:polysaccharide biosynthesis protein PslG
MNTSKFLNAFALTRRRVAMILTMLIATFGLAPHAGWSVLIQGDRYAHPIHLGVNETWHAHLIRNANVGWSRVTLGWRDINPAFGVFDWPHADVPVGNAEAQGLQILAVLSHAPLWAGSNEWGSKPPSDIDYWRQFVRAVAQRYAGRVAAYEIWNEPNFKDIEKHGIGWDQDLWVYPRYIDYVRVAAQEIRTYAPGTLVVAPATSSKPNTRTSQIFGQIEQASFPDGPGSSFIDVVSFHANGPESVSYVLNNKIKNHLEIIVHQNPSNRYKPIWITEFGWESPPFGDADQGNRIREVIVALRGTPPPPPCWECPPDPWEPQFHAIEFIDFKITHVFIYSGVDAPGTGVGAYSGIYNWGHIPKWIVPNYLQTMAFPSRHLPENHLPFWPSCSGLSCTFYSSTNSSEAVFPRWDFGDGSVGHGFVVNHTFPAPGQYFVSHGAIVDPVGYSADVQLISVP